MNAMGMALRMLMRDWRAGELRILALSLTVAVASVTAVAFFTDRIERAMQDQAADARGNGGGGNHDQRNTGQHAR